jgi:hypothetical protein
MVDDSICKALAAKTLAWLVPPGGQLLNGVDFASANFFFFVARPYSGELAARLGGKSLAGQGLASGNEATIAEYCPRGWDSNRAQARRKGAGRRRPAVRSSERSDNGTLPAQFHPSCQRAQRYEASVCASLAHFCRLVLTHFWPLPDDGTTIKRMAMQYIYCIARDLNRSINGRYQPVENSAPRRAATCRE